MSNYLGNNIKFLRKKAAINQAALGLQIGKGQKTIGNWETGFSEPNTGELIEISKFFGVSVDDLLTKDLSNVHLTEKKGEEKSGENVHLNVHGNVHPKGKNHPIDQDKPGMMTEDQERFAPGTKNPPNDDLFWRDKYIAMLEKIAERQPIVDVDPQRLAALESKFLAVQEFVVQLAAGGLSAEHGPISSPDKAYAILSKMIDDATVVEKPVDIQIAAHT